MRSSALLIVGCLAAVGPVSVLAQRAVEQVAPRQKGYVTPRTPWGDPDLQGIWPGTDMVRVPLERPRQQSMMMSSEFLALRRGLMSLIREESLKAMGGEISEQGLQGLNIDLHGQSLADVL